MRARPAGSWAWARGIPGTGPPIPGHGPPVPGRGHPGVGPPVPGRRSIACGHGPPAPGHGPAGSRARARRFPDTARQFPGGDTRASAHRFPGKDPADSRARARWFPARTCRFPGRDPPIPGHRPAGSRALTCRFPGVHPRYRADVCEGPADLHHSVTLSERGCGGRFERGRCSVAGVSEWCRFGLRGYAPGALALGVWAGGARWWCWAQGMVWRCGLPRLACLLSARRPTCRRLEQLGRLSWQGESAKPPTRWPGASRQVAQRKASTV
ncbi:hypothetical protein HDA39_004644 [Kribbella italica]|uniref:Uncharacterized protein n=1 Tax=Kribbella italica TaxID=1540520 RepID=A0A7W9JA06_9ACTN|nr:hypothetical protein [Kribbella italica]